MMESSLAIDVQNLHKSFDGKKVVDDVSIQVPRGQIYGFLGPNGSGKTTTIRLICGLLTPDQGSGTCLGLDIRHNAERIRQRVGYMTQKFSYWEDLSIRENLAFVANMYDLDHIDERIHQSLENLGLVERQHQLAGTLSGGWKQRLALAACILHNPDLLLLDEPTAGVDPQSRREFWDEIHRLASQGLTVLVSTHYMDEAERCHAIIYIADGKIMTKGTVSEVIAQAALVTWIVRGPGLIQLQSELLKLSAVDHVAPFGDSLHVSGAQENELARALHPWMNDERFQWTRVEATLEDAFIHYMLKAQAGRGG